MSKEIFIGVKTTKIYCRPACPAKAPLPKNTVYFRTSAQAKKELMRLRGVGRWTAEYVCLRCLKDPAAFPADDVGLQKAIKRQLRLTEKPTIDEIYRLSRRWKNWEAYATFYLWNSLI